MKNLIKGILGVSLFLFSINLCGQNLANSFKIGDYIEVFENNKMLVYLNCTGAIVEKKCAEFYRTGKTDSIHVNFAGEISDYYLTGEIALKANIVNDQLNGEAQYYYKNGILKSEGHYKEDIKAGVWTYYYPNGNKEKIINYIYGYPFIVSYFNRNGKESVVNGNGKYVGEFNSFKGCNPFTVEGEVKNGKMDGKWTLYNPLYKQMLGYEYFEDGKFIKGVSGNQTYTNKQNIFVEGFSSHENITLYENHMFCPGDRGIYMLQYKGKSLHAGFYPELLIDLECLAKYQVKNQWVIVGFNINETDKLTYVNVKSSIDDEATEKIIHDLILAKQNFTSTKMGGKNISSDVYYSLLIRNNQIIIPSNYIYNNR